MSDYAVCPHLPIIESEWDETDRSRASLCGMCDTLYCPECAPRHAHGGVARNFLVPIVLLIPSFLLSLGGAM